MFYKWILAVNRKLYIHIFVKLIKMSIEESINFA